MRLDDIKARAAAATDGPWSVSDWEDGVFTVDEETAEDGRGFLSLNESNATFIAHARTDIPDLLRVVEAAVAMVQYDDPTAMVALRAALAPLLADE